MYRKPPEDDPQIWARFFAAQTGHGSGIFEGDPYQRGGFAFGGLLRGLMKTVLPVAKRAGKTLLKEATRTGMSVASDALAGQNVGESFEKHGRMAARQLLSKANNAMEVAPGPAAAQKQKQRRKRQKGPSGSRRQKGGGIGLFRALTKPIKGTPKRGKRPPGKVFTDVLGSYLL